MSRKSFKEMVKETNERWYDIIVNEAPQLKERLDNLHEKTLLVMAIVQVRGEIFDNREPVNDNDFTFDKDNLEKIFLEPFEEYDVKMYKRVAEKNGWTDLKEIYKYVKKMHCRTFAVISIPRQAYIEIYNRFQR